MKKSIKKTPANPSAKASAKRAAKGKINLLSKLPSFSLYPVLFALLWVFCSFVYDDVFYICQQHTYFAFDAELLKEVMRLWYGPAVVLGRFLMLPFRYPIIGGALYAFILTAIAYLINTIFKCKRYVALMGVAIPLLWLLFLVSLRLDIFYHYEPSFLMYVPVILLIMLAIVAGIVKVLKLKNNKVGEGIEQKADAKVVNDLDAEKEKKANLLSILLVLLTLGGTSYWILQVDQNTYITASLQRSLQQFDWESMISTAKKAKQPSRPICAYYATALGHTNHLKEHLFDIYFQYPQSHLTNRNDFEDIGTFFYMGDLYLYMGLANPSWHSNIDHLEMEGLSAYKLKNLCLTALVNNEIALADKIFYIIEQMPFEGAFVDKFKPMLYDRNLVKADPVLGKVLELLPRKNVMEQQFFAPLFLGYYVDGGDALPKSAEPISMAASLYTKNLDGFIYYLSQSNPVSTIPTNFEEAIMIYNKKHGYSNERISPYVQGIAKQFVNDGHSIPTQDKKEKAKLLKDKYLGMYFMYYFYENIPDENYPDPTPEQINESKVN